MKIVSAGLVSLALLAGPALAQGTCEPSKLAAAVDRYAESPFSALNWRVLQGLGDPLIEPATVGADTWAMQERWRKLAGEILPDEPGPQEVSWGCRIGYPLQVLERRAGSLGKDHPYVKQWLLAQEQVLRACNSNEGDVALPPPLELDPSYVNLQKIDRAYQEASIAFYRDKQKAIPLFRAIADSGSQHRGAARYNIANLLANAREPAAARHEADAILADPSMASVHAITRELKGFIANQEDTAEGWSGLIDDTVGVLNTPADEILAKEDMRKAYGAALYDIGFLGVRQKEGDWWLDGTLPENPTISKSLVDASRRHPMTLWMMAGQTAHERHVYAPWSLIGDKWLTRMDDFIGKALTVQPSAGALNGISLDMLKALRAKPDDQTRAELWAKARSAIEAAAGSCGAAPETAATGFLIEQATRLSALANRTDEAVAELSAVPFKEARAYRLSLHKLMQFLTGQGNLADARKLRDTLLTPELLSVLQRPEATGDRQGLASLLALIAEDETRWKQAVLMKSDPASDITFNFLPISTLWALAGDAAFTAENRALFARAAWTRDYALVRRVDGEKLEKYLGLNPEIKAAAESVQADYPEISPRNQRLLTILRVPAHNILVAMPGGWEPESIRPQSFVAIDSWNPNDKNWWCPLEPDRQLGALRAQADRATGMPEDGGYVLKKLGDVYDPALRAGIERNRERILKDHPMIQAIDWKEIQALARMPSGPRRLSEAAIRWAKTSRGGDGAPEALALAVRTTRYGCNWHGSHEPYSKAAQQLLTRKFEATPWQRQTPYWFGCRRTEWNANFTEKVMTCEPKMWPEQKLPR